MKLQTKIPLKKASNQIDYDSKMLLLGSCFVENIGRKLDYFKFQIFQNPFGILFHPLAVENLIKRAVEDQKYSEEEVFENNGKWLCFDAHSDLSARSKNELIQDLNGALTQTKEQINKSTHITITLGTAWIYRRLETDKIVANCHKFPQKEFKKELLSIEEIKRSLVNIVSLTKSANPQAQIIFTISPVRHLKDGFVENQRSKAHLIAAIYQVLNNVADTKNEVEGFPSYEIMMDELRDYRFYAKDMVHPNELAIDYIWEKFKEVWISEKNYAIMDEVETIQKGLAHRPFNSDSEEHQKFKESLQKKITYLKERCPNIQF